MSSARRTSRTSHSLPARRAIWSSKGSSTASCTHDAASAVSACRRAKGRGRQKEPERTARPTRSPSFPARQGLCVSAGTRVRLPCHVPAFGDDVPMGRPPATVGGLPCRTLGRYLRSVEERFGVAFGPAPPRSLGHRGRLGCAGRSLLGHHGHQDLLEHLSPGRRG